MDLQSVLGNLEGTQKDHARRIGGLEDMKKDHETRLRACESFGWKVMGGIAVVVFGTPLLCALAVSLVFNRLPK